MILEDGRAFQEGGTANKGFKTKKYRAGLNNRQIVQPLLRYLIEYTYDGVDPQRQVKLRPGWPRVRPRARPVQ